MGKIAGVIVVQMMIMSSLYTEGKPQDVTAEKAGCSHSAVKKHLYRKLTARENCGKSDRGDSRFERIVKKGWFKNLQELHKEWMEVSVTTQMSLGNEFQCQKCLFGLLVKREEMDCCSEVLLSDESQFSSSLRLASQDLGSSPLSDQGSSAWSLHVLSLFMRILPRGSHVAPTVQRHVIIGVRLIWWV